MGRERSAPPNMPTHEQKTVNYRLAWYSPVSENIRAIAASVVADVVEAVERETGLLRDGILVLLIPVDTPGAFAAHRSERVIPDEVRKLADNYGFEYLIVLAAGLFEVEPASAEVWVAHEFAHVVLGHCDNRVARFVTQFGIPGSMFYFHYELAADEFAARLGYGQTLINNLRELRMRTTFGKIRVAFRAWKLSRILAKG